MPWILAYMHCRIWCRFLISPVQLKHARKIFKALSSSTEVLKIIYVNCRHNSLQATDLNARNAFLACHRAILAFFAARKISILACTKVLVFLNSGQCDRALTNRSVWSIPKLFLKSPYNIKTTYASVWTIALFTNVMNWIWFDSFIRNGRNGKHVDLAIGKSRICYPFIQPRKTVYVNIFLYLQLYRIHRTSSIRTPDAFSVLGTPLKSEESAWKITLSNKV